MALGVCDALRDAELLSDAVASGHAGERPLDEALTEYGRRRDEATLPHYRRNLLMAAAAGAVRAPGGAPRGPGGHARLLSGVRGDGARGLTAGPARRAGAHRGPAGSARLSARYPAPPHAPETTRATARYARTPAAAVVPPSPSAASAPIIPPSTAPMPQGVGTALPPCPSR
jgi:hypothetical protein